MNVKVVMNANYVDSKVCYVSYEKKYNRAKQYKKDRNRNNRPNRKNNRK